MPRWDTRLCTGILIGCLGALLIAEWRISSYVKTIRHLETGSHSAPPDAAEHELSGIFWEKDGAEIHEHHDTGHSHESNLVTDLLYEKVTVLCWIMTHPTKNNVKKVKAVNETWAKRCNKVIYFSTYKDLNVETVELDFQEGRKFLWDKTKKVLTYLHQTYGNKYDWYFKADDDTFTIMENLRFLVSPLDSSKPYYVGCPFKLYSTNYNSGGAGYLLSKAALSQMVNEAFSHKNCPTGSGGPEDYNLGKCLNSVNITPTDTRDLHGRLRFLPLSATHHITDFLPKWFFQYITTPYNHGIDCCSDLVTTFHYITPDVMYMLEFFTYHLTVYGRQDFYRISSTGSRDEVWRRIQDASTANRPKA